MTPILPPFPFPEKWNALPLQMPSKWCIPPVMATDSNKLTCITSKFESYGQKTGSILKKDENLIDEFCFVEDGEQFFMNDFWADRFSKTLKRIKKKAHKANQTIVNKHGK